MPYTHTNRAQLITALSQRLGDPNKIFWVEDELWVLLTESLRTFGLLSGFWRERGVVTAVDSTTYYDLPTELPSLLSYNVTDRDIVRSLQYHLLESTLDTNTWYGTEMFTLDDLLDAIYRRRDQFLADTGCRVTRSLVNVASPPGGRQPLSQSTIDVRHLSWLGASPRNYYTPLWRSDERMLTSYDNQWSVTPGAPAEYSVMAPPPLQLQLAPLPIVNGQLEMLSVDSGPELDVNTSATLLTISDDLSPAVKWGALADLLGIDGIAADPFRAAYCEQRYQQYVQLARMLPVVIHAEINGVPLIPNALQELDATEPKWQNQRGQPTDLILPAPNLIGLNPVPDGTYSITVDVVRNAPIPSIAIGEVQVGREQLDMILDYAEHLALFKVAGKEWHSTERQAQNFLLQSITYNQRIAAAARAVFASSIQSQDQKQQLPRRKQASGIGALK